MKIWIRSLLGAVCLLIVACVEPYNLNFGSQKEILFIEADINNYDQAQFISLKKNIPEPNNIVYIPIENAKVQLFEGKDAIYDCSHTENGRYVLPTGFQTKPGKPYQLKISIEGKKYESTIEIAKEVSPIEKIYSQYVPAGIDYLSRKLDGHRIFIDTKDPSTEGNYYFWQWKLYEKQNYCVSCNGGKYYTAPAPLGRCVEDANLKRRDVTYDYMCSSDCWDILYNDDVNIMSDIYSNGSTIKGRLVANIPFFQYRNALIEVQQYAISKSAFDYFNILVNQTQRNGTLADTPPAGLIGNIKNVADKTEAVGGIFMVSSKTTKVFVIERNGMVDGVKAFGLLKGRIANPEPSSMDITRPPFAPCTEGKERTAIQPIGWID